jgi:hypothetical protein
MSRRKSDAKSDARFAHRKDSRGKNRTVTAAPGITKKKTIAITPEAYDELTCRARAERTDRKTLASQSILTHHTTNLDAPEKKLQKELEQLDRILKLGMDQLEKDLQDGTSKLSVAELERLDRIKSRWEDKRPANSREPDILSRWNMLMSGRDNSAGGTDKP